MLHKEHDSYKYVLPLKNSVNWVNASREKKCHNIKNEHFEKKCPKVKTHIIFSPYDYLL